MPPRLAHARGLNRADTGIHIVELTGPGVADSVLMHRSSPDGADHAQKNRNE